MLPRLDSLLLHIAVLEQDGVVFQSYCEMFKVMNRRERKSRPCKNASIRVLSVLVRLLEHHVASRTGPASTIPTSASTDFPLFDSISFLLPHLNLCINNNNNNINKELSLRIGTDVFERKVR